MTKNAIGTDRQTLQRNSQQTAFERGEPVTDGAITVQKIEDQRVRIAIGDDRWTLPVEDLPGGLPQAQEMQRERLAALAAPHESWCHRATHRRVAADSLDPVPECVAQERTVTLSGTEYGSYWTQRADGSTVLFTEWPGGTVVEMSVGDVRAAYRVTLAFSASPDVDQVAGMLSDALDEVHGGDDWRDSL